MQTATKETKDRSLFEATVTAAQPPVFSRSGSKVKLIVWLSQRFESPEAMKERCAALLQATPDLNFASDTNGPATLVLRAMLEKEVIVYDARSLQNAKISLARSVEKHLDTIAMIQ